MGRTTKKLIGPDLAGRSGYGQTPADMPVPWRQIFRRLSLAFGWTPQQIAELTLPQMIAYLDDSTTRKKYMLLPAAEARAYAARLSLERRRDHHESNEEQDESLTDG